MFFTSLRKPPPLSTCVVPFRGRHGIREDLLVVVVADPFPDVAQHVVEAPSVRLLQSHRMRRRRRDVLFPRELADLVPRRIGRRAGTSRVLPFELRRQTIRRRLLALVQPLHEPLRIVPRHAVDRMPRGLEDRRVGVHHLRPLALRDFVFADVVRAGKGDGEAASPFALHDLLASRGVCLGPARSQSWSDGDGHVGSKRPTRSVPGLISTNSMPMLFGDPHRADHVSQLLDRDVAEAMRAAGPPRLLATWRRGRSRRRAPMHLQADHPVAGAGDEIGLRSCVTSHIGTPLMARRIRGASPSTRSRNEFHSSYFHAFSMSTARAGRLIFSMSPNRLPVPFP